jgi:hypothetical protein
VALSHSPQISLNGLVLCLDAANRKSYPGSGTTWTDLSGRGNNGTLTNMDGTNYSSTNGGSLTFDGTNEYVDVADIPFRFSNTFSISTWFYWNGINQSGNILSKRQEIFPYSQYGISIMDSPYTGNASNVLNFFARHDASDSSAAQDISLQYSLSQSGFYCVSATMSPSSQSLYVNGILRSSSSKNISTYTYNINNKNFWVGSAFGSSLRFTGNIAQVSIYNRALTAAEIQQNFNALRGRFGI